MKFFYEGLSCPVCGRAFEESDDVVACPKCGAPHHRECWLKSGGCSFADAHGTDRAWSRERAEQEASAQHTAAPTKRCPNCGAENPEFSEFCGHCGSSLERSEWQSNGAPDPAGTSSQSYSQPYYEYKPFCAAAFDPCGGVSPDEEIEGERAEDLAAVVKLNSAYYIPRFSRMAHSSGRVSWNWPAFLIPSLWLFYRKQYAVGGLYLLFDVLRSVMASFVQVKFFAAAFSAASYAEMIQGIEYALLQNPHARLAAMLLMMLSMTEILLRVFLGLFGNRLYMRSCLHTVRRAREGYPEGYRAQLGLIGGTSVALSAIAYMTLQIIPFLVAQLWM